MPQYANREYPVNFRKEFTYEKTVPTFVSNNTGAIDEIARWVLDRNDILYKDEPHAPHFHVSVVNKLTGAKGNNNSPVLQMTDALIYSADSIVQFLDQRNTPSKRLVPGESGKEKEVMDLYDQFTGELNDNVTTYFYSQLLTTPKYAKALFKQRVSLMERLRCSIGYGSISSGLKKELNLPDGSSGDQLAKIKLVFKQVDDLLSDGRKYLTGDKISLADIAFASIAAPLILPEEFGGALPSISHVPDQLRKDIIDLRATRAGQFVLLIYQEDRPVMRSQAEIPKQPGFLGKLFKKITISMGAKKYKIFFFLQRRYPVLRIWFTKLMTVNKNDLLTELLQRDNDFTVEEINARKMANQKGAFFLGMDRNNPQFDRERNFVRAATKKDDLEMIRTFVRAASEEIIQNAQDFGKLDVANSLNEVVLVRLIDYYFGIPSPTETIMRIWLRALFYDLFLNFTNNKTKHQAAVKAADERKAWLQQLIKDRKQDLKDGKELSDNLLNRLILMQAQEGNAWFDDDTLQRNMGGLITGILETTNKAIILVLDELFRRPEALQGAIETAQVRDMKKMYGYVCEALRFNPAQPGVIRYSENKQTLTGKGNKTYNIPPKSIVFALTAAAMFDPAAFPDPKKFNPERDSTYMNYGFALHECYGKYINTVTISELVAAVLRLKNVRREPGMAGRGTGLTVGPFPNNFVVVFDEDE